MIAALWDTFVSSLVKRFLVELERVPTLSRYGRHRLRASPFKGCLFQMRRLPRAEFAFANHPFVPVHLMLDSVARRIAFADEQANYLETAFRRVFDAPLREKFYCLADVVFVL
jgi:hypothetical protein